MGNLLFSLFTPETICRVKAIDLLKIETGLTGGLQGEKKNGVRLSILTIYSISK